MAHVVSALYDPVSDRGPKSPLRRHAQPFFDFLASEERPPFKLIFSGP
jgi:hypothetical protein